MKSFDFIDLFAGIGGFHYALSENGGNCVFASEIDEKASSVYESNHRMKPAGDITEISAHMIPKHDVIAAGFPCQTFSIAGKRKGFADVRGTLFKDILRIAEHHQPKVLFLENVRNFASHDSGRTLETVKKSIIDIGYNFYSDAFVASDFGIPQARKRYIMIAIRKDLDESRSFEFPSPPKTLVKLEDILESSDDIDNSLEFHGEVEFVSSKFVTDSSVPMKPVQVGVINKGRQGERVYDVKGHAITLSASGGGPGGSTGLYIMPSKVVRKLTAREAARLQGFPESFTLPDSQREAWKQFGNAVPVPMISVIMKSIIDQGFLESSLND